jgi:hypothetical protein
VNPFSVNASNRKLKSQCNHPDEMLLYFRAAAGGRLILDSLQPTGVSPASTKKDAPFLPQIARTCEPLLLDMPAVGSGAREPPPDGLEGVPLELGETGALGGEAGVSGAVPEGALGVAGGMASGVPEGALGVTGGAASGIAPEGVLGFTGGVASGIAPEGVLGVAGGIASGIAPEGGVAGGVLGKDVGGVGVGLFGCALLATTSPKVVLLKTNKATRQLEIFMIDTSNFLTSFLRDRLR